MIDDRFFSEFTANRGSVLHRCYDLILRGKLDRKSVHPDLFPWLDSFEEWVTTTKVEVIGTEREWKDENLGLIGHCDLHAKIDGLPSIVDHKGGVPFPWHRIQVALYRHLATVNGHVILRKHSLHVHSTGKRATLITHMDPNDDAYAMHIIGAYNARKIYC